MPRKPQQLPSGMRWHRGKIQVRYYGTDGRRRSRTFDRLTDAKRFQRDTATDKARGVWTDPALGRVRLEDWAAKWLASARPTLKPKTIASYDSLLKSRILPALGSTRLGELKPSDVQAFIAGMVEDGLSASRIRQAHVVLSRMLTEARRDGYVARNAADDARLPRLERKEAPFFTPDVVDRIAGATPPPYGLLVSILGVLGPRWGEAVALRRESVNLMRRRLHITENLSETGGRLTFEATKTFAQRSIPLPDSILTALEEHLESIGPAPEALIFTSPTGGPLRYSNFRSRVWDRTLRSLGLPVVGLHVLRHSAAARMISLSADPKTIQTVLGHSSVAFTLTVYGHLFDADLDNLGTLLEGSFSGTNGDQMGTSEAVEETGRADT